ncbi:MAG: hypothetical protein ABI690_21725 [Chloroflexota bacterium]
MEFTPLPGSLVDDERAASIVNQFRAKFHWGDAERLLSIEAINEFREKCKDRKPDYSLPLDILQFRKAHYGDPLWNFPKSWGGSVLTWLVFPKQSRRVDMSIFDQDSFHNYAKLYYMKWSVGYDLKVTTPGEIQKYFVSPDHYEGWDEYVFDPEISWCIVVTHELDIMAAGEIEQFA